MFPKKPNQLFTMPSQIEFSHSQTEFLKEAIPMMKDIYTWWETIKAAGKQVHDWEDYYMIDPDSWCYSPDVLIQEGNIDMLRSNWQETRDDYTLATRDLERYHKSKIFNDNNKNEK